MKNKKIILPFVVFVILLLWGYMHILSAGGLNIFINYLSIDVGDKKQRVVELLGEPDNESMEFYLGQKQGYEEEYAAAEQSNSVEYFVWNQAVDIVYSIGFDQEGKVTIKAYGGT